jgi:hypothetical protein
MMDVISTEILDDLVATTEAPCVSITLPTHRAGREVMQDPIRFKNLLGQAERRLLDRGMRPPDVTALLEPARGLVHDSRFWSHQEAGLVVYAHRAGTRSFRIPTDVSAHVTVGDEPDLEPLRVFLEDAADTYWILAISQHDVRLVRSNRFTAVEVDLPDAPRSFGEANWFVRREPQIRSRSTGRVGSGRVAAALHGPGGYEHDADEDLLRFLRGVDAGVHRIIGDASTPVVLAGVGSTLATFRHVCTLRHVVDAQIEGAPDHLGVDELHRLAQPLVEDVLT